MMVELSLYLRIKTESLEKAETLVRSLAVDLIIKNPEIKDFRIEEVKARG